MEDGILMLKPLHRVRHEGSLLKVRVQTCTLLGDDYGGVVLQVEQVSHVLGQVQALEAELRAGNITHGLVVLLWQGLLLIMNREECKWFVGSDSEAVLTQRGESHMRHLLDGVVYLVADDGSPPRCCRVEGYLHPDLTSAQAAGLIQTAAVGGYRPVVAESDKRTQELSWDPRAVSARGLEEAILPECTMGVVVQTHLKNRHETITNPKVINSEK
jgi:hypothetical protein